MLQQKSNKSFVWTLSKWNASSERISTKYENVVEYLQNVAKVETCFDQYFLGVLPLNICWLACKLYNEAVSRKATQVFSLYTVTCNTILENGASYLEIKPLINVYE